ncbi:MAG: arylsulfatase [Pseudomonadota bacterium]
MRLPLKWFKPQRLAYQLCCGLGAAFLTLLDVAVAKDPRPNIVVILIDDGALMDLGVYGGEAATPNIDALAAQGALFTNHRSSPLCAPSRAMLLTGLDNHRTGFATIPEVLPPEHAGQPGYSMRLEPGVLTIADHLALAGYRTVMAGKWHLGRGSEGMPDSHGFDRSFALDASGGDSWDDKAYLPLYTEAPWYEDGDPAALPKDFYSSEFIVDRVLDYLGEDLEERGPFFAYLPFLAVHLPLQAPSSFTEKYKEVYAGGWDEMLQERWQRAKALGLIAQGAPAPQMAESLRAWDSLTARDQELLSARMAVHAGMLEAMDYHVGRLIDHLKAENVWDNTIIVVTSDNGPDGSSPVNPPMRLWFALNGYRLGAERIGEPGSFTFIGHEFASAAASPSRLMKFYASEGGIRVPLIVAGPGVEEGAVYHGRAFMTDIAPTLLEMAAVPHGSATDQPMDGRSLLPILRGETDEVYGLEEPVAIEVAGNATLYQGSYKLVRNLGVLASPAWQLFDLSVDPGETNNLAASEPVVMTELMAAYQDYRDRMGVLEVPLGYQPSQQAGQNNGTRLLKSLAWVFIAMGFVVAALATVIIRVLVGLMRS